MATHHSPQSLPSFAQAFSPSSLNNIHSSNSLPPIQARPSFERFHRNDSPSSRHPSVEHNNASHSNGLKRSRDEGSSASNSASVSRQSPRVRIKEEDDHDMLEATPTPPSPPAHPRPSQETVDTPMPNLLAPPSKKRRVTVSGSNALGLNTDVRAPSLDPSNTTPISPAVMGFTIGRDDPAAIEQVRSMLTVKQKQKALIEQRRGSVAGVAHVNPSSALSNEQRRGSVAGILTVPSSGNSPRAPGITRLSSSSAANPLEDRPVLKSATSIRGVRRSPNIGTIASSSRRIANAPSAPSQSGPGRPPSPSPLAGPTQQTQLTPNQHLAPPPISFAHRRAGQSGPGKNKPADIVISPREAQSPDQLAPSIQSAPPVPHAQGQSIGRFGMTLPRVPSAMCDSQKIQRVTSGRVPPTPTRLSMQRGPLTTSGMSGRSPPSASIPISTTLVPPTPTSLHRPGYVGEKSAFLAPFEMFYDSLNDSKQLKSWLGEQLQKSNALMQSLQHQQETMDEIVERAVEKRTGRMRDDIVNLRQKVEELESSLRSTRTDESGRRLSVDMFGGGKGRGKYGARNGILTVPELPAPYTFPPVEPPRPEHNLRVSSPGWGHDPDREGRGSEKSTHLASSSRYEPLRPQPTESPQSLRPHSQTRSGYAPSESSVKTTSTPTNSRSSQPPRAVQYERSDSYSHRSPADLNGVGKSADEGPSTSTNSRKDVIMSPPQDTRHAQTDDG